MKVTTYDGTTALNVLHDVIGLDGVAQWALANWPHNNKKSSAGLFSSGAYNRIANAALEYTRIYGKAVGPELRTVLDDVYPMAVKDESEALEMDRIIESIAPLFAKDSDEKLEDESFRLDRAVKHFSNTKLKLIVEETNALLHEERFPDAYEKITSFTPFSNDAAPVVEESPWPAPPRDEAFAGLAGEVVAAIEPHTEADRTALLVQFLVAAGNAMGRSPFFRVESTRHGTAEFAVIVGETSKGRKGTSWGQIQNLMAMASGSWSDHHIQHGGMSSGEGLIWKFKKKRREKDDGSDPGDDEDKRLLVLESEFASVLKQLERQGNTLSAVVRAAWDGVPLSILTKNAPMSVRDTHISLIGHVTSIELIRYLQATETANGFGNRILWVCSRRSKKLPEGGSIDGKEMGALADKLRKVLCLRRGEMKRSKTARGVWCEAYDALSEGKPGMAGAMLGRSEAHVTRLSLIYACLDNSPNIKSAHIRSALALWDYCERSVLHLFGTSLGDPTADKIMKSLRAAGSAGMTRYEIHRGFGANKNSADVGRALDMLEKLKLAKQTTDTGTGGRPAERWTATR